MRSKSFAFLCLWGFWIGCIAACKGQDMNLSALKWKNRVLLVFGNELESPKPNLQKTYFEKGFSAYQERDIVFFVITETQIQNFQGIQLKEKSTELRKKFQIRTDDFCIILIGKDGSEKFRTYDILSNEKLYAIIDAMPMRKSEMKKN